MTNQTKPMRIMIVSELYPPSVGGTEITTQNLARGLAKLECEVMVVAPGHRLFQTYTENDGDLKITRVRAFPVGFFPNLTFSFWPKRVVARTIQRFKPDIIEVNNPFPLGLAAIKYGHKHGIPVVAGCHLMPESFLFWLRGVPWLYERWRLLGWRLIARAYNQASLAVGPTETSIRYVQGGGMTLPMAVISNGVSLNATAVDAKDVDATKLGLAELPTVLYLGRMGPEKSLDVLIKAAAIARKQLDLQLVLIGRGPTLPKLLQLAGKMGLGDRVVAPGFVSAEDKAAYLAAANVFVIPSPVELQSIVTLEAMAAGKPVIAVSEGALSELVSSGKNGELFTTGDYRQLAGELVAILSDPKKQVLYGKASHAIALQHDIRDMPQHYLDLYNRLLSS